MELQINDVFSWIFKAYGKEIVSHSKNTLQTQWNKFNYGSASKKYFDHLISLSKNIQIWCMNEPIALDEIYVHLNVLQELSARKIRTIKQVENMYCGRQAFGEPIERGVRGDQLSRTTDKLYILGKPGSGKTTFLKYIINIAIKESWKKIPIYVPLRRYTESGMSLFDFIVGRFAICSFPQADPFVKKILEKGKAIILFDGLDEVNAQPEFRKNLIDNLTEFIDTYNKNKYIITCRINASEFCFKGFTYAELCDFSDKQIRTFIRNWFKMDRNRAEMFLKAYSSDENSRFQDLAKIPLLLTLLCVAYQESYSFPTNRSEVYNDAINALLQKWDATRNMDHYYHGMRHGRKLQMLTNIASDTFKKGQLVYSKEELTNMIERYIKTLPPDQQTNIKNEDGDIDGSSILKTIIAQHGFFVERAKNLYTFSHLTIQEHFMAKSIVESGEKELNVLFQNLFHPNWREVFLLTAERINDSQLFFDLFKKSIKEKVSTNYKVKRIFDLIANNDSQKKNDYKRSARISYYFYLEMQLLIFNENSIMKDLLYTRNVCGKDLDMEKRVQVNKTIQKIYQSISKLTYIRDLSLTIGPKVDKALSNHLSYELNLSEELLFDRTLVLNVMNIYNYDFTFMEKIKSLSKHVENGSILSKELATRLVLNQNSNEIQRLENVYFYLESIKRYRNLGCIDSLSHNQQEILKSIFISLNLFVDCLNQAVCNHRKQLEDTMFNF